MSKLGLRADAAANRDRILAVAAVAVRRDGESVPLATIAAEAGAEWPPFTAVSLSREALLGALTHRSLRLVLDAATHAAHSGTSGVESLALFLYQIIDHGPELVLPLHGGPMILDQPTVDLRAGVHAALERILEQGQRDSTVSSRVTAFGIVLFGAFLARPLPHVEDRSRAARRQVKIFLSGISPARDDGT